MRISNLSRRAAELLELAISELDAGRDALPIIGAAETVLRVEAGELPDSEMAEIESIWTFDCDARATAENGK